MTEQETQGAVSDETSTAASNVLAEDVFVQDRTLMQYFFITLRGALMGWADVIPGVSGGTMALILGIYHELVASIRSLDFTAVRLLLKRDFKGFARHTNIVFLVFLGAGIGSAVVVMARIMPKLMKAYPAQMKGLFFGLVLASIFLVLRRIDRHTPMSSLMFLFGTLFAYFVVGLLPGSTPNESWFLFLVGCIAICAMILPGISGAFLLLVFGKYAYVLNALSSTIKGFIGMIKTQNPQLFFNENLLIVVVFGTGCVVGILSFSRLLNWLLKRFHLMTMAVLAGLMLGSLRRLWPFQHEVTKIIRHKPRVVEFSNQWPASWGGAELAAVGLLVVGFVAVFLLDRMTSEGDGSSSNSSGSGDTGSDKETSGEAASNDVSSEDASEDASDDVTASDSVETASELSEDAEKKKAL